jgi:hypothetical protein
MDSTFPFRSSSPRGQERDDLDRLRLARRLSESGGRHALGRHPCRLLLPSYCSHPYGLGGGDGAPCAVVRVGRSRWPRRWVGWRHAPPRRVGARFERRRLGVHRRRRRRRGSGARGRGFGRVGSGRPGRRFGLARAAARRTPSTAPTSRSASRRSRSRARRRRARARHRRGGRARRRRPGRRAARAPAGGPRRARRYEPRRRRGPPRARRRVYDGRRRVAGAGDFRGITVASEPRRTVLREGARARRIRLFHAVSVLDVHPCYPPNRPGGLEVPSSNLGAPIRKSPAPSGLFFARRRVGTCARVAAGPII